jgi:hypothetical protein
MQIFPLNKLILLDALKLFPRLGKGVWGINYLMLHVLKKIFV